MKAILEKMRPHSKTLAPLAGALGLLVITLVVLSLTQSQTFAEPISDPAVEKMVNTNQAGPGDTLTYTIHAWREGSGEPIYNARITDTVADELEITGVLSVNYGSCGFTSDVLTWTGDLGDVWITFTAEISPGISTATIANTADLEGDGESYTSNSVSTAVSPGVLEVKKMVSPEQARPGEELAYTVYISNTGNGIIASASMSDELPEEVDWAGSFSASHGDGGAANDVITWTGSVAPSQIVTIIFTADITDTLSEETTSFTNTVNVTGAGLPVSDSVKTTAVTTYTLHFPAAVSDYPPIPDLDPISALGDNNTYVVSWEEIDSPNLEHYVLQESTSSNFSTYTEWETTNTSRAFVKGAATGTFYYRVRADGTSWGDGNWSNTESISLGYLDNFDDPNSGWPDQKVKVYYSESQQTDKYLYLRYKNGDYQIYLEQGGHPMWFKQPDALAPYQPPSDKYCVETEIKFVKKCWWCVGGLVIGAPENNSKLYMFFLGYLGNNYYDWNLASREPYIFPKMAGTGSTIWASETATNVKPDDYNKLSVSVDGNHVRAYLNGTKVAEEDLSGLKNMTRVGVFGGDYEITPSDFRFKYFKVIPNVACE